MRNLRSLTRDGTHGPLQWKQSLNHWTTKEVPSNFVYVILKEFFLNLFIFGCAGSSLLQAGSLSEPRAGAAPFCGAGASHREHRL